MADTFCSMEQKSSWSHEENQVHFHCIAGWCTPVFLASKVAGLWKSTYFHSAYSVHRSREAGGQKKLKLWVREINEELIYRECRTPPQQSREKQGRIAAPPLSRAKRAQAATSPLPDTAATRGWVRAWEQLPWDSWGAGQEFHTRYTMGTSDTHLHDHKHGRDRTVLRLLPFNHSFTGDSSQSTSSLSSITPHPCLYLYPEHKEIHSCD